MKHSLAVLFVFTALLLSVVLPSTLHAQTAAMSGTITDSTGAVVQGAQVTVRNLATNVSRVATSSATGAILGFHFFLPRNPRTGRQDRGPLCRHQQP